MLKEKRKRERDDWRIYLFWRECSLCLVFVLKYGSLKCWNFLEGTRTDAKLVDVVGRRKLGMEVSD
jgi:hypothetical protein